MCKGTCSLVTATHSVRVQAFVGFSPTEYCCSLRIKWLPHNLQIWMPTKSPSVIWDTHILTIWPNLSILTRFQSKQRLDCRMAFRKFPEQLLLCDAGCVESDFYSAIHYLRWATFKCSLDDVRANIGSSGNNLQVSSDAIKSHKISCLEPFFWGAVWIVGKCSDKVDKLATQSRLTLSHALALLIKTTQSIILSQSVICFKKISSFLNSMLLFSHHEKKMEE